MRIPHASGRAAERRRRFSAQSAMEYLMTYGWSILIIAVVLVAMWQLGIIGGGALGGPRATAGACQVVRNVQGSNLEGQCTNLIPQYVANFPESSSSGSYVQVPDTSLLDPTSTVTVAAWVKLSPQLNTNPDGTSNHDIVSKGEEGLAYWMRGGNAQNPQFSFGIDNGADYQTSPYIPSLNTWYFVVGTYDGTKVCLYVDGVLQGTCTSASGSILTQSYPLGIGTDFTSGVPSRYLNGTIANVQIYNTSLSQAEVTALYQKGIGGAPVSPAYTVGWWPLNGNTNDYSATGNNGAATNVVYIGAWTSGYTPP